MTFSEFLYNTALHTCLPVPVLGTYLGFTGRDPDLHTSRKFIGPDLSRIPRNIDVWIHGASVGEMGMINFLVDWLTSEGFGEEDIFVTAQTMSGLEMADHPHKNILPADYPALISPLQEHLDPEYLLVMETEIWPNLFSYNDNRVILINGRLSNESYYWYRRLRSLVSSCLSHCRCILTRSEIDNKRFQSFAPESIQVSQVGNLKWCSVLEPPDDSLAVDKHEASSKRPVMVAGSTHSGEEDMLIELAKAKDWFVYLAPRHLNRIEELAGTLDNSGISWCLWSDLKENTREKPNLELILVDEIGVLEPLYQRGDVAYVGGSLESKWGGHNLMEPAQYGVPVITGPYLSDFESSRKLLEDLGMLDQIKSPDEFMEKADNLLNSSDSEEDFQEKLSSSILSTWDNYRDRLSSLIDL